MERYKTKDMLRGNANNPNNLENPILKEVLGNKYSEEDGFIYWGDNEADNERQKENSKDRYGSG